MKDALIVFGTSPYDRESGGNFFSGSKKFSSPVGISGVPVSAALDLCYGPQAGATAFMRDSFLPGLCGGFRNTGGSRRKRLGPWSRIVSLSGNSSP